MSSGPPVSISIVIELDAVLNLKCLEVLLKFNFFFFETPPKLDSFPISHSMHHLIFSFFFSSFFRDRP